MINASDVEVKQTKRRKKDEPLLNVMGQKVVKLTDSANTVVRSSWKQLLPDSVTVSHYSSCIFFLLFILLYPLIADYT